MARTSRLLLPCCVLAAALAAGSCKDPRGEVLVFHAASLSRVLAGIEQAIERAEPDLDLRLEPSGSQVAARKISELNRPGDLVLSADARVIESILIEGGQADWNLLFATNEIVLAHGEHSPFTDTIDGSNWPELLQKPGVRLGRASEHLAPIGYQSLQVWKLAERHLGAKRVGGPGLAGRLVECCQPAHVVPDIAELTALLESRTIDYAFLFRNVAEEHNLKVTALAPEINLSREDLAPLYASVSVPVRLRGRETPVALKGAPILYSLTIPRSAPHPERAVRVVEVLLGSKGRSLLERSGFHPLDPPRCAEHHRLPDRLRARVANRIGAP